MKPYELFEHTADIGLRLSGATREELFRNAALGLAELITDPRSLEKEEAFEEPLEVESAQAEELLAVWLRELLFRFSTALKIPLQISFETHEDTRIKARVRFARFDPRRHEQRYEIKAVTYHGYRCEKTPQGYFAEVILDI